MDVNKYSIYALLVIMLLLPITASAQFLTGADTSTGLIARWPLGIAQEGVGAELLPNWDFTAEWASAGGATINDSDTFTTTFGASGVITNPTLLTVGGLYSTSITGSESGGTTKLHNIAAGSSNEIGEMPGSYSFGAVDANYYIRNDGTGTVVDVSTLSLKPITTFSTARDRLQAQLFGMSTTQASRYTTGPTGQANTAMIFDGTDDFANVADNGKFNWRDKLCAGGWTYRNDVGRTEDIIGKYNTTGDKREWLLFLTGQKLTVQFGDPTNGTFEGRWISDDNVVTTNTTWYHVAFTYNAGTVVLYVNGVAVAGSVSSGAIPVTLYNGTADVGIGVDSAGTANILSGLISDPFISLVPSYTTVRRMYRAGGGL